MGPLLQLNDGVSTNEASLKRKLAAIDDGPGRLAIALRRQHARIIARQKGDDIARSRDAVRCIDGLPWPLFASRAGVVTVG